MKWTYIVSLLALFSIPQFANGQDWFNIEREEIRIPLSDGIELGAILYRPKSGTQHPAIIYRTPYGIDDYDSYAELPRKAAQRGYLVFLVDVRGRYRSEGQFEAYRNEKQDGFDVIEWVANHPLCNGKVGSYGGSYPGIVQWQAMSMQPPHLLAAAPEMTPIGSHHFFYYGGAFSMTWLDWFVPYILPDKRKRAGDTSGPWDDSIAATEWVNSDRKSWYQYRPLNDIPILKKYAPEYFEWLAHPESSGWWDFVNMEDGFEDFVVPVFLLTGWYDSAYGVEGAWRAYTKIHNLGVPERVRQHSKLIIGPWNHTSITTRKTKFGEIEFGPSAGLDYDEWLLRWFDHRLKNEVGYQDIDPVWLFVMGANQWRSFQTWPIPEIEQMQWFLGDKGELVSEAPPSSGVQSYTFDPGNPFWDRSYEKSFPFDQRDNENRDDVLTFTSEPLTEDLEVIGAVTASLFVSSTAPDTDFAITITDVYPDGQSINLSGLDAGYLRMRYREGYDHEELMTPGEMYEVEISNLYTANVFKKGHKIRVSITSSKAPHFDPNPNTATKISSEIELRPCTNSVYFGGATLSKVTLPVYRK